MSRESKSSRSYDVSPLPTLQEGRDPATHRDVLFKLYDTVNTDWLGLSEVRFKLLGLLPSVSLLLIVALMSSDGPAKGLAPELKVFIALLGLMVTLGLIIYERRNSELYDDLVSRGRKLEAELGVETGVFRGRLKSTGIISHGTGTALIYGPCVAAWIGTLVFLWLKY
jgi:hypothetical protein